MKVHDYTRVERFQLTLCDSDTHHKRKSPPESRDTFSAATETELTEEKPHASLDPPTLLVLRESEKR